MGLKLIIDSNTEILFEIENCSLLGRGATGSVYELDFDEKTYAVKVFDDKDKFDFNKIQVMIDIGADASEGIDIDVKSSLAWPLGFVEKDGIFCGFFMHSFSKHEFFSVDHFFDFQLRDALPRNVLPAVPNLVEVARNIAATVARLHEIDIFIIDLKPQYILVSTNNFSVALIDCDGFSVPNKDEKRYPASLVSADYIAPEIFEGGLAPGVAGIEQDNYALAVLIFKILNRGIHPFQGVIINESIPSASNDENAVRKLYPYGDVEHGDIRPHPASVHSTIPSSILKMFEKSFTSAFNDRVTSRSWEVALTSILDEKKFTVCERHPIIFVLIIFFYGFCV
jgi:DNA-binding helix-hairpin-helix protein with protein kinase domain